MITVFVPGVPAPQGSAKAFVVNGHAIVTHDNENTMPWRSQVASFIRQAIGPVGIVYPTGPVTVDILFLMPRRKAEPKRVTPAHTRKPDCDKLLRACLDALTGLIYTDDAQVTQISVEKRTAHLGEQPGARITWSTDA